MIDQNTLSRFKFFADLPVGILADMAAASCLLSFEPSKVIFRSGDEADTLYGVIEGEVELSLEALEKNLDAQVEFEEAVHLQVMEKVSQISVDTARPGNVFGWSALTGKPRRTVTATCGLPTKVAAIPAQGADQFEGVYWSRHENWDPLKAAMQGSSYYKLPKILQWFSGNIGLHHVHHVFPRIPNYKLQHCYDQIPVLQQVRPLTIRRSLKSLWLNLWDEREKKLVSFQSLKFHAGASSKY